MSNNLSPREVELLRLAALGFTNGGMSAKLGLSATSIPALFTQINLKLGAKTRPHAVALGFQKGILKWK